MRFESGGQRVAGPSPYYYVAVPASVSADIHEVPASVSYGSGAIPVEARIGEAAFTTSPFPKHGRYLLPLRDAISRKALHSTVS
ncbi:MAG: DUF1905 domain-containing protein [Actinobacteria bacterium]|nr:DUF1905 domain-containing protein [Actinomycetota bacterium]